EISKAPDYQICPAEVLVGSKMVGHCHAHHPRRLRGDYTIGAIFQHQAALWPHTQSASRLQEDFRVGLRTVYLVARYDHLKYLAQTQRAEHNPYVFEYRRRGHSQL